MSLTTPDRPVISDGLPSQLPDVDPAETREWVDSLRSVVAAHGPYRARFLMLKMLQEARALRVGVPALRRHFGVDAESITVAVLQQLAARGELDPSRVAEAVRKYRLDEPGCNPTGISAGGES